MKTKHIRVSEVAHAKATEIAAELTKNGKPTDIGEVIEMAVLFWKEENSTIPCPNCEGIKQRVIFTQNYICTTCSAETPAVTA